MTWRVALVLLLLVAALLAPLWLRDPLGRPIMVIDDWLALPEWVESTAATIERSIEGTPAGDMPAAAAPAADAPGADVPGADAPLSGSYYRWQDASGVWHFSDRAPPHLVERLQPLPLPELANGIGAPPVPGEGGRGIDSGGIGPVFDSSMSGPLPAGLSREAIETLLEEAHERRMGEER